MNAVSSVLDSSNIYGANCQEADSVRDQTSNIGLLRVVPQPLIPRSDRMPISPPVDPSSFCRSPRPNLKPCFLFGDFRDNENPGMKLKDIILHSQFFTKRVPLGVILTLWSGFLLSVESNFLIALVLRYYAL